MCLKCVNLCPKQAKDNFYNNIKKLGGKVIGEYVNSSKSVECECEKGHKCYPIPSSIQQGCGMCPKCSRKGFSKVQIDWLNHVSEEEKIAIQHAENEGEYRIGRYKIDGYCKETNTVYEFHGDFWHGNPKFYDNNEINPVNKKSFGKLFKATLHKELYIKNRGYNYVCIWEHEWNLANSN